MRLGDSHSDHTFDGLALVYRKRFNELYRFRWEHGEILSSVVFPRILVNPAWVSQTFRSSCRSRDMTFAKSRPNALNPSLRVLP